VLLIVGVFAMLYIRERRMWIWLQPAAGEPGRTRVTMALSTTRRTLDADAEFERLRDQVLAGGPNTPRRTPTQETP
jgi:cytochrome c biogenesis protein